MIIVNEVNLMILFSDLPQALYLAAVAFMGKIKNIHKLKKKFKQKNKRFKLINFVSHKKKKN